LFQIIVSVAAAHRACLPSAVRASDAANEIKPVKEYKKQTIANSFGSVSPAVTSVPPVSSAQSVVSLLAPSLPNVLAPLLNYEHTYR
jgi:hypothetical protein